MSTVTELYNRFYAGETVEAHLTDGRFIRDISHNDDGSYYLWTDNGELSSDGERMVIVRSLTPTPLGKADASCANCAPTPPTITGPVATTITGPVLTEGRRLGATYYEVVTTFPGLPARRYRLHNEWNYGIDDRGPGEPVPGWYATHLTIAALDLPPETIQALRAIWDSLFRPAPTPVQTPAITPIAQPAYTLTEQLEALRREAHTAQRQGRTEVVTLLKERACDLAERYLDDGAMCDQGHWLNEYGQCETCLEAAQQLACARAHVNETHQRWQFEAETTEVPF